MSDFKLLCKIDGSRTIRAGGSVNCGRSVFSIADSPPVSDFSDMGLIDMYQCELILLLG